MTASERAADADARREAERAEHGSQPGESLIAAIMRQHDPRAGSGLTEADRQAIAVDDRARIEQQLTAALELNAKLLQEHDRIRAEISELRVSIALRVQEIAVLSEQLQAAPRRLRP